MFDKNTSQQEIYNKTTKPLLEGIIEGFNATVFAYGATGSGKTYTMLGNSQNERGIMPRAVSDLFKILQKKKNKEFRIQVSYIEIYNEEIRDLLGNREEIKLHEDPVKGVLLQGVKELYVDNVDNFFDILYKGNQKRTTGKTNANETSSRSHALLKINIENKDKEGPNASNISCGRFILVDLAGSEKNNSVINNNSNNNELNNNKNALRQQEGAKINQSLLNLGICINALASKSKFIPWRNSKLTHILKDYIGGNAKVVMISTISPSLFCVDETLNTLNYSNRAKNITTIIKKNVINVIDRESQVNKYKEIINNLSDELEAKRNQLAVITNNKYLLPKKDSSGGGVQDTALNSKMDKLSKEITSHFNEEMRVKLEIFDVKKNINNLVNSLKDKEFSLYKLLNKSPNNKRSFNNSVSNNSLNINLKEKDIRSNMKKITDQIQNQKSILLTKESKYNELVQKRSNLEAAINKFGNVPNSPQNINSNNLSDNTHNFSALQYLYHSYILEMNNLENDFIRKQNSNEIISKDIKINRLLEQLKIRDEYISQEKKSLASKKIKFVFEQEKDIKKIEDLSIESKNFSLPYIVQQDKRLNTQNFKSVNNNNNLNIINSPSSNSSRNKVNLISNGQYDYSGYTNPNIIMEKKVIRTKTNEIMTKTKKNQLSELKLNMLNDQYKNSKVMYVNKGDRSFHEDNNNNIIIFDTKKLNKSQSFGTISARSKSRSKSRGEDSFNNSFGNSGSILNFREREIDNKIKRVMIGKKKASPYLK